MNKKAAAVILFSMIVYIIIIFASDATAVSQAFFRVPYSTLIAIFFMVPAGYVLRGIRWKFYLSSRGCHITWSEAIMNFMAGLAFTVSPGKLGEMVKAYPLKRKYGMSVSETAPLVMVERLNDLLAMLFLAALGFSVISYGFIPMLLVFICVVSGTAVIRYEHSGRKLIELLCIVPQIKKHKENLLSAYLSIRGAISPGLQIKTLALSIPAWAMEAFALYFLIRGLGYNISLLQSIAMFAIPSILGVASMLPGGIGVAEGSMAWFAHSYNMADGDAAAVIVLIRFFTLWYGSILGFLFFKKLFLQGKVENITELYDSDKT